MGVNLFKSKKKKTDKLQAKKNNGKQIRITEEKNSANNGSE